MSDIFISYAKEDREKAAALAAAMESNGWTVWWDREIPPGRTFDEVIEEALRSAHCVVVLWSGLSVASRWVRAEASMADERGILVPALVDHVLPPLEFRRIQAADLVSWHGDRDDPELRKLFGTVGEFIRGSGKAAALPTRAPTAARGPRFWWQFAVVGLVGLLIGVGIVYPLNKRRGGASEATQSKTETPAPERSSQGGGSQPAEKEAASSDHSSGASSGRLNLLLVKNGGHLVRAPHENWVQPIDGSEQWDYITGDEAVYAFKDERPATFDTFAMLITETRSWNIKEFELLAGNETPDGRFESIGKFETQNVRLFPSPWQEFKFKPTRAKYLKVRVLSVHRPTGPTQVEQWQLLGSF